jgi:hypothetical protein
VLFGDVDPPVSDSLTAGGGFNSGATGIRIMVRALPTTFRELCCRRAAFVISRVEADRPRPITQGFRPILTKEEQAASSASSRTRKTTRNF